MSNERALSEIQAFREVLKSLQDRELMDKAYHEVISHISELNTETKHQDYCGDTLCFRDYFIEGVRDAFMPVYGKALRLKSLVGREADGKMNAPNHESIEDNAKDLAAYSVWLAVLSHLAIKEKVIKELKSGESVTLKSGEIGVIRGQTVVIE
jgi:curved DNA-binding protein CbpA